MALIPVGAESYVVGSPPNLEQRLPPVWRGDYLQPWIAIGNASDDRQTTRNSLFAGLLGGLGASLLATALYEALKDKS